MRALTFICLRRGEKQFSHLVHNNQMKKASSQLISKEKNNAMKIGFILCEFSSENRKSSDVQIITGAMEGLSIFQIITCSYYIII